jgi:hypothetical protein
MTITIWRYAMHWIQWLETWIGRHPISLQNLAVIVGGIWIGINYVLGRTHKNRVRLRVFAKRRSRNGDDFLVLKTELKNVGLSRVKVKHAGCSLTICVQLPYEQTEDVWELPWRELAPLELYKSQNFVEPNGLLIDTHVALLPRFPGSFVRVQARFESTQVVLRSYAVVPPVDMIAMKNATNTETEQISHRLSARVQGGTR